VELVVAEVEGGVDRLERLEVDVNFLLFALFGHNRSAINNLHIEILSLYKGGKRIAGIK